MMMNELWYLVMILALLPLAVLGIYAGWKIYLWKFLGYTAILNPKKDGSYSFVWTKIGNKKNIKVEGQERIVEPKGRFTGPLGNLYIYVGENARPIVSDDTAQQGIIDVDDVGTIASLTYYAGRLAGARKLDIMEKLMYLMLAAVILNGILLAMYWQDRAVILKQLAETVARLRTLTP